MNEVALKRIRSKNLHKHLDGIENNFWICFQGEGDRTSIVDRLRGREILSVERGNIFVHA